MKIRILGGGWYGCSTALALKNAGHEVDLHEIGGHLFCGASGANPARLHLGFHYPRSQRTRELCQRNHRSFMQRYGHLTRSIATNIYAIAEDESLVDFGTYLQILKGEVELIEIDDPKEFGLKRVEGAVLTGERHIVIREAREYFTQKLKGLVTLNSNGEEAGAHEWVIDCTFSSANNDKIDRYEACVTAILEGPDNKAVTIMDGPFSSVYPWDDRLCSLTSAKYTPAVRSETWAGAKSALDSMSGQDGKRVCHLMMDQMAGYYPAIRDEYALADWKAGIRAMPKSAADARLVDVETDGLGKIWVRAGKIDAVLDAERQIFAIMGMS